jgi:hypothetical protein
VICRSTIGGGAQGGSGKLREAQALYPRHSIITSSFSPTPTLTEITDSGSALLFITPGLWHSADEGDQISILRMANVLLAQGIKGR